ncbi:protein TIC 62, chloroplastic [Euphorbia lathyris]|uniref:protein TIC 62, chloroplastic n=1 Tax=Euphorbia lathyris TaxID=212925 RepID=UPI00331439AF
MESCSLPSSTVTTIPTSFTKTQLLEKTSIHGQVLRFPAFSKNPPARKLKIIDIRAQSSGVTKFSSAAVEAIPGDMNVKDDNVAFVAGATGKVGSRTVRELIKLGFRVRAGVRSAQRAQTLVQSVKQLKLDGSEEVQPVEKLEIVECDLEKPNQIVQALGNASLVFCCIGASEKEVFDITGPYRIDYLATKNLVDAATVAKVKHFFMVSSLGTNKVGFPAAILNLFWGVLIWKRKAEEALIASGIPYTIVRPGGMERPTDAYKETHNLTLSKEDTLFGGQVSNLQIAEFMAFMAKNLELSYCKVVEVIAETTAPLTPVDKLLQKIPSQRVPPKEPVAAVKKLELATSPKVAAEPPSPSPPIEKEAEQPKAVVKRPLSPYTAYEDLKPPTSPCPTQVTGQKESGSPVDTTPKPDTADPQTSSSVSAIPETISSPVEAKIARPLSPYTAYEDLKPPTSPRPTPSGPKEVRLDVSSAAEVESTAAGGNDVAKVTASIGSENNTPLGLASSRSPYMAYDDLKPPTSPSPTASVGLPSISSVNGGPKAGNSAPPTSPSDKQQEAAPKQKPLSPYAMYEDLKPPTSPSPSQS